MFAAPYLLPWASLVAQRLNNLHAMRETWVQSLGQEDPLATHSSILAWIIPWMEEPGKVQSMGSQRGRHNWNEHTRTQDLDRKYTRWAWRILQCQKQETTQTKQNTQKGSLSPHTVMKICQRNPDQTERDPSGQSWEKLHNRISEVVLDYSSK